MGTNIINTKVFKNSWIRRNTTLINSIIKENVFIGFRSQVYNTSIDEGCQIASKSIIGRSDGKRVNIGAQVWIGAQVVIFDGISIGHGSVIGAGAIVAEDIPPNSIVIGRPAKVIKRRDFVRDKDPEFKSFLKQKKIHLLEQLENEIIEILEHNNLKHGSEPTKFKEKLLGVSLSTYGENCFLDATFTIEGRASFGNSVIAIGKSMVDSNRNVITDGGISMGANVSVGDFSILEGGGKISIGNNTIIGKNVHIVTTSHNYRFQSLPMIFMPVTIGENVIIGDGSFILGGVKIGDGAIIQPNSIVLKDVSPKEIHYGHLKKEEINT
ncbi:bacterial transferase hexapeptide family protein [Bacillus cereus ATCC 4342]|uniref:acyltransferase n=1 Tax=Bacillus tropicus TaxID=2026188 RepID=UPI000506CFB9|nr:acyltransferase [Bacillus tropicus]AJH74310.1 hexapeptide repeat of succinyl-transferase family protein [Bacillus cereus ATCC 4342]KFM87112.1 bacterial transferase hexapeptide family protein [Bacillus cereus ATCC 4342]MDR4453928.1 acyltransferase [Bacillus tropicus]QKH54209.1 acyltransferase [Bacillus tropicus]